MKKYFLAVSIGIFIAYLSISIYIYYLQNIPCVDVIQPARNIITGKLRDFGTPCQLPFWYVEITL